MSGRLSSGSVLLSLRRFVALVLLPAPAALLPAAAQSALPSAAIDAAAAHVRARAASLGLAPADVADLVASDGHVGASGVAYVYLRQCLDGLDVTGSQVSVAVAPGGRVLHVAGHLAPRLVASAGSRRTGGLSSNAALAAAAAHVGAALGAVRSLPAMRLGEARAEADGLASPAVAREVYHRSADGALTRAWQVSLDARGQTDWWLVTVDAATGAELDRQSLTIHEPQGRRSQHEVPASRAPRAVPTPFGAAPFASAAGALGTYRVFPIPVENPTFSPAPPPGDGRELVTDVHDALASPFAWHDTDGAAGAELTTTQGNNVHAYTDVDNNNAPDPGSSPDGGAGLLFDFPVDFTQPPSAYRPAAVTNLFYWNNVIHDVFWHHGFDEASGNFQVNNYGRGGLGGDDVRAESQDGSGTNNANFSTPAEGERPRMQMYIGTNPTPDVDGSFNNTTITHEYGHGISIRLTGGPTNVSCLSTSSYPEQMGEGWSDFFALMLTARATDTPEQPRAYGAWFYADPDGIRPAPYSTSFAVNNFTYQRSRTAVAPHGIGHVWATILWEVAWEMIAAHGFSPDLYDASGTAGNQMMLRLVVEGLKLQPCGPGFVDGRDAILAADAILYPDPANPGRGLHYATLWTGFARRGLGASASQGSSGTNADNTEAFDLPLPPPALALDATAVEGSAAPGASVAVPLTVRNTAPAGHAPLNLSAAVIGGYDARPGPPEAPGSGDLRVLPTAAREKGTGTPPPGSTATTRFGTGGPDTFGYIWVDSDEPGGPTFSWVDIASTGTAVTLADDAATTVTLPFPFPFYGTDRTSLRLTSNGWLGFAGSGTATGSTNASIPSASPPNDLIAAFWDDLNPAAGGSIRYQDMGDGRFVVSWLAVPRYNEAGSAMTFQAILYATGEIVVQYQTMVGTRTSATVGIENPTGTDGLQVVVNASYVEDGLAVRFAQPTIWATVAPATASVAPADSTTFTVTLDAADLTPGTYTATLRLSTNDPEALVVDLPVTFVVGGTISTGPTAGADVFALGAVAPNPTRGGARVRFTLPDAQTVRLSVTDLLGREVALLVDGPAPAGASEAALPADLPSGVYLVRLVGAGAEATRRVTVVR